MLSGSSRQSVVGDPHSCRMPNIFYVLFGRQGVGDKSEPNHEAAVVRPAA